MQFMVEGHLNVLRWEQQQTMFRPGPDSRGRGRGQHTPRGDEPTGMSSVSSGIAEGFREG